MSAKRSSSGGTSEQPSTSKKQKTSSTPIRPRVFCDPVHGHIELSPQCASIIDTPQFQRLRFIKQLGLSYYVYPGASHNRFEHCIGTSHLAKKLATALRTGQEDLKIDDTDVLCVEIAGLCHDLGHGPFSHSFEKFIRKYNPAWKHETQSIKMFEHLINDNNLELKDIGDDEKEFIKELINPPKGKEKIKSARGKRNEFLLEIVSNEVNGIDVDKWDYFARDCHMSGVDSSFQHERCIRFARVIKCDDGKQHICFRDKELADLCEMFMTRSRMHRCLYQHKISNLLDHMVTEALNQARKHLTYSVNGETVELHNTVDSMEAYTLVNDDVFTRILYLEPKDEGVKKAKKIIKSILQRDLFDMIDEIQEETAFTEKKATEYTQKLLEKYGKNDFTAEDIILDEVTIDFGKKEKNPIDTVWFYSKNDTKNAFHVEKKDMSSFLPQKLVDKRLRLFCRRNTGDEEALRRAFRSFF